MKAQKTYAFTSTHLNRMAAWLIALVFCCLTASVSANDVFAADTIPPVANADTMIVATDADSVGIVAGNDTIAVIATDDLAQEAPKAQKWVEETMGKPTLPWFQGFTVSVDVLGAAMKLFSSYGTFEAALRLSLKNTLLPIAELGYGFCNSTNDATHINFKTNAPFLRVGMDYNLLKNKFQDNRLFVGLRYGFSSYKYDMSGPDMVDPVWKASDKFEFNGIISTSHWMELVVGCQVKIYGCFHMGWSARVKFHMASTQNQYSKAYYIPGYGTTTQGTAWSGSYNLIFDLNWGKKKYAKTQKKQ